MGKICDWYRDSSCDCFCNGLNMCCENYSGDLCTDEDLIMYYDVVCSVYEESEDGLDYRVDSHLLCGGFETEDDATEYINAHDCTEYDDVGKTNLYTCIEIEGHKEDGSVASVITVN